MISYILLPVCQKNMFLQSYPTCTVHFGGVTLSQIPFKGPWISDRPEDVFFFLLARRGIASAMPSSTLQSGRWDNLNVGGLVDQWLELPEWRKVNNGLAVWKRREWQPFHFGTLANIWKGGIFSFQECRMGRVRLEAEALKWLQPNCSLICLLKPTCNKLHQTCKIKQEPTNQPCMFFRIVSLSFCWHIDSS